LNAAPAAKQGLNQMLSLGVILYLLVSVGMMAMGIKYIRAKPPMGYHAEITKADELGEATLKVFGALYKVMGGGFLSLGIMLVMVTLFGVWNDALWAKLTIPLVALIAGGFFALIPRELEQATGVRTPWRIAAALTALTIVAFVISFL
jgi:hypothetical protein